MSLHDIWRGDVMPLSGIDVSIGRNSFDPPAPVVPVFDVHHRSTVFNALVDSSDPATLSPFSGILSYHSKLAQLGIIPNGSGVQPVVLGAVIDVYRAGADYNLSAGTFTSITLDTTRVNTNPSMYELKASGIIQVHASGVYDVIGRASLDNSTAFTQRYSGSIWLQKLSPRAGETGFTEIPGTRGYTYNSNLIAGDNTALIRCIIRLEAEDLIQLVTEGTGGALVARLSVVADGCGLTFERLE